MTKKELYSSLSAIALAVAITGCGDGDKNTAASAADPAPAQPSDTQSNASDTGSQLSTDLDKQLGASENSPADVVMRRIKELQEQNAKVGKPDEVTASLQKQIDDLKALPSSISTTGDGVGAGTPSSGETGGASAPSVATPTPKLEAYLKSGVAFSSAVHGYNQATSALKSADLVGTYWDYVREKNAYDDAWQKLGDEGRAFNAAKAGYAGAKNIEEPLIKAENKVGVMASIATMETQYASALSDVQKRGFELATEGAGKELKKMEAAYRSLGALPATGRFGDRASTALKSKLNANTELQDKILGRPVEFAKVGAEERRNAIAKLFAASPVDESDKVSMQGMMLHGDLEGVKKKIYEEVVAPKMRVKYAYIVESRGANTFAQYSLEDVLKIGAYVDHLRKKPAIGSNNAKLLEATTKKDEGVLSDTWTGNNIQADVDLTTGDVKTAGAPPALLSDGKRFPVFDYKVNEKRQAPTFAQAKDFVEFVRVKALDALHKFLLEDDVSQMFFKKDKAAASGTTALSAGLIGDASKGSYQRLRRGQFGIDAGGFSLNGSRGEKVVFDLPVSVSLHGKVESGKSVDTTASVSTKLGNTLVGISQAYVNTGTGFTSESLQAETSVMIGQKLGAAFAEVQLGSVDAKGVNKADFSGSRTQVTLGVDTRYVTPFVQLTHRNLDRQGLLMKSNVSETTVALGAEVDIAKHTTDAYQVDLNVSGKVGYNSKSWTAYGKDLGTDMGVTGSLEMKGSLKLNTGMTFSSNLSFGSVAGSSAGLNLSLER